MNRTKEIKIAAGIGECFSCLLRYHVYFYLKPATPNTNTLIGYYSYSWKSREEESVGIP